MAELKVSQRAREAAGELYLDEVGAPHSQHDLAFANDMRVGDRDDSPQVQHFARFEQATSPITGEAREAIARILAPDRTVFFKGEPLLDTVDAILAALPLAPREGWQEEVGELRKALEDMESACEQLAATRPHGAYLAMIDGGQDQALLDLDAARRVARAALSRTGEVSRG